MKILITGGGGYIARNLKQLLTDRGYHISAPTRSELDLLDRDNLSKYLRAEQFDAIIHAATKGGKRNISDTFENTYIPNILMFENLNWCRPNPDIPIIMFGSGAEFDRRRSIENEYASSILSSWPIDPYGLSKNLITRRAITYSKNIWVLRLFGCFNYDEDSTRFIKHCILSIKENRPIIIHQQKTMDFFFLDDIVPVIERLFATILNPNTDLPIPNNINLTYNQKHGLIEISQMISHQMNSPNHETIIETDGISPEYTGNSQSLMNTGVPLVGLKEGIRRTINKLL